MTDTSRGTPRRSLFALIGDIPRLLMDLVRSEIEGLQKELLDKVKHAGVGIGLIVLRRHGRNTPIPFGPYLAAAGVIALFWGAQLTRSYLGLMA